MKTAMSRVLLEDEKQFDRTATTQRERRVDAAAATRGSKPTPAERALVSVITAAPRSTTSATDAPTGVAAKPRHRRQRGGVVCVVRH
jgi:hypothetical protein